MAVGPRGHKSKKKKEAHVFHTSAFIVFVILTVILTINLNLKCSEEPISVFFQLCSHIIFWWQMYMK